jgi:hypothetical protein
MDGEKNLQGQQSAFSGKALNRAQWSSVLRCPETRCAEDRFIVLVEPHAEAQFFIRALAVKVASSTLLEG